MQAPVMRPIAAPAPQPSADDMPPEANPVKEAGEA
jgi:hypothetical protein